MGTSLGAQELARPRLEGRVLLGDSAISSATVVLHRVTPDTAGEIDSVRVDAAGGFAFALPSVPDPGGRGEVYFGSVRHLGIHYFGPAVHTALQLDSLYMIQVRDTALAPLTGAPVPLGMRYLVLEPGDDVWRVTDLFQLENTGDRTLVAKEGGVVWNYPLPPGASDFEVGGEDLPPDAVDFVAGSFQVGAPLPPGEREYVVRYQLAERSLDLPLPGRVGAVELLVPEPAPFLTVEGLAAAPPVEMEPGVTYRRFTGSNLVNGLVRVLPGTEPVSLPIEWLAVILALVLAAVAVWAVQRQPPVAVAGGGLSDGRSMGELREALLLEVALIDERMDEEEPDSGARDELIARRALLVERLGSLG